MCSSIDDIIFRDNQISEKVINITTMKDLTSVLVIGLCVEQILYLHGQNSLCPGDRLQRNNSLDYRRVRETRLNFRI